MNNFSTGGGGIDTSPRVEREVELASEPVGGRSRVTELSCYDLRGNWYLLLPRSSLGKLLLDTFEFLWTPFCTPTTHSWLNWADEDDWRGWDWLERKAKRHQMHKQDYIKIRPEAPGVRARTWFPSLPLLGTADSETGDPSQRTRVLFENHFEPTTLQAPPSCSLWHAGRGASIITQILHGYPFIDLHTEAGHTFALSGATKVWAN